MTDDAGQAAAAAPARLWLLMLARAAVALLLGLTVLALDDKARPALANFIGVYWLIGSLLTLRWVWRNRRMPGNRLVSAAAAAGVVAGILVLARLLLEDVLSVGVVLTLLGVTAILTGLLRLSGTFRDHVVEGRSRLPHRVALGALEIVLGILLVLARSPTRPVAVAAGLWALVGGAIMLVDALELRRMG